MAIITSVLKTLRKNTEIHQSNNIVVHILFCTRLLEVGSDIAHGSVLETDFSALEPIGSRVPLERTRIRDIDGSRMYHSFYYSGIFVLLPLQLLYMVPLLLRWFCVPFCAFESRIGSGRLSLNFRSLVLLCIE